MGYNDTQPPDLRADPVAARLHQINHIHIMILDIYRWDTYYLFWTVDGRQEQTTRITEQSSPAGTVDYDFPAHSGSSYTFQVQGCPLTIAGPGDHCSPRSDVRLAKAAVNLTCIRAFLLANGIDPVRIGLRSLGVMSMRDLLNGA
jgi:hypothetical protein